MSSAKFVRVVNSLIDKTSLGEADWELTEIKNVFQVSYARYSVRISIKYNNDNQDILIQIINSQGEIIDEFTDVTISSVFSGAYVKMDELYTSARRKALGVDKALDELLEDMEDDDPF